MRYDFLVPARTLFGWGRFAEAGAAARALGTRAFIVSGSRQLERDGTLDRLDALLKQAGVQPVRAGSIHREPRVEDVDRLAAAVREKMALVGSAAGPAGHLVIGIGGGSAIDLAKAASAMAANRESPTVKDYLEGVGKNLSLKQPPLPMLAIPTTAGTGSECTKNAVISSDEGEPIPFKKSLRSDLMVPRAVLLDPQLAVSMPPEVTARTGMDAITQLIESAISCKAQPIPTALAFHGLSLALPLIERAVKNPLDQEAREGMAHAAYLSGITLANAGLGMAHGVAAALGISAAVPHGLACAVMLPAALEANGGARPAEIARVARLLTRHEYQSDEEAARAAPAAVRELCRRIGIPLRLRDVGVRKEQIPAIVKGSRGNSMNGNPRPIDDAELAAILESML
ncbi:MAG: iron-containing alcohol dehydrogenase [Planctomycetes bacterium]|nr:iron-containing alcohol dehydrogenase [Planctomycetota bacterium]